MNVASQPASGCRGDERPKEEKVETEAERMEIIRRRDKEGNVRKKG